MLRISNRQWHLALFLAWIPVAAAVISTPRIIDRFGHDDGPISLKVDLSERQLYVLEGGEVIQTYGVAVGTSSHPTPQGSYRIGRIEWNPSWVPPKSWWARKLRPRAPGDPRNPMQGVKLYFREPAYYIHGTNDPASIGTAASHGCLRMRVGDAKELANLVEENRPVTLRIVG
jgi:lipoprotein-anchoring transpeptidase ErfK/SrfK